MTTRTTERHTRPVRITALWRSWLAQNRAYGEAFERWAHPGAR
ncbi:MAG: hypothetical protein ACRDNS_35780 [Trebonia sp.]